MDLEEAELSREAKLLQKHKKENKELQAEVQRLKHAVPKGDRKRKKEVLVQIAKNEAELELKHKEELDEISLEVTYIATDLAATTLDGTTGTEMSNELVQSASKPSKAQKRRERKAAQDREREERIKDQEVDNLSGARYQEAQKLKIALAARGMGLYEIASDGNCLYAAVADQLSRTDIQEDVWSLRAKTANHMRQNQDDFLPFLSKSNTGNPYTSADFLDYCNRLENMPEWGGQLELRALSNVLERPIEVVQADTPVILTGEDYSQDKLILSYHRHMYGLGEHYNSAVDKSFLSKEDEEDDYT